MKNIPYSSNYHELMDYFIRWKLVQNLLRWTTQKQQNYKPEFLLDQISFIATNIKIIINIIHILYAMIINQDRTQTAKGFQFQYVIN
ncbi:transmembrane protein, putative (macronuclear) [Tetrahymena thermophila SB210]|uniref:Transmembrane protein, putative n=1 Tax=Tetrahymena thermophila (strain SB210) TaxID=312017 RepID=I7MB01_TETTS|nr:transmembrane protein, putative [Tetrahymena thermophila SB210]EAS07032.2 transmembrane protein, putative [Tetrahymena thermophila SB210]|eukprot:XP_001027274.2 transmembrane protein, putative [Tetrahymena thermophila SB210]